MATVEITAMGMVSCLGGLVTGSAAQRAGLRRAADALDYEVQPEQELARVPARVCALPAATFGFSGVGRLTAILHEIFQDLGANHDLAALEPPTEIFVALPDPIDLGIPVSERLQDDPAARVGALGKQVLANAGENLGGSALKGPTTFFAGRVGFAQAAAAAIDAIEQQRATTCVVAALDTLVDRPVLDRLLLEQRLKTDDNPVGLVPGEGGAVFWFQAVERGAKRGGVPVIAAVALREGARATHPGRDLAACVSDVARAAAASGSAPLLISDHNGEASMAAEWGSALAYLRGERPGLGIPSVWFPAIGFGDCGVASGALGLCVAARALVRGYAPSPTSVVVSSDETARAAMLLRAPSPS